MTCLRVFVDRVFFRSVLLYTLYMKYKKSTKKLSAIFRKHHIATAYLFGSTVHGYTRPDSDVDIAVQFVNTLPQRKHHAELERLRVELNDEYDRPIDLINLDTIENNPLLRHNAVFSGKILYMSNSQQRFTLERSIMREYEDTQHLRQVQSKLLRERLRTKTFGKVLSQKV